MLELVAAPPLAVAAILAAGAVRDEARVAQATLLGIALSVLGAVAGLALGADRLGATVVAAAALIALITAGYAARAMQGSSLPYRRFFALFSGTAGTSFAVAAAGDLRLLALAWVATGLGTSALLGIAGNRAARRSAARHAALELLGTAAWAAILAVTWQTAGRFALDVLPGLLGGPALVAIALLLVVAGAVRSAIVPFHGWLPDSMEAPTPVSAFMHAGLVNGAGVLFAKTAGLLVLVPGSLGLIALLGGLTAALGSALLLVRPEAKRRLGWSTVAQMGFMVLQCGCGGFAAAIVHLIAHGGYKSAAFLNVPAAIVARRDADRRPAAEPGLGPVAATCAALAVPLAGVAVAVAAGGSLLAHLPAAPLALATAAATGAAAARAAAERPAPLGLRLAGFAAIAAAVAAALMATAGLDRFLAAALPLIGTGLPALVAATLVAVGGLLAACGVAPRYGERTYALALGEAHAVPLPAGVDGAAA